MGSTAVSSWPADRQQRSAAKQGIIQKQNQADGTKYRQSQLNIWLSLSHCHHPSNVFILHGTPGNCNPHFPVLYCPLHKFDTWRRRHFMTQKKLLFIVNPRAGRSKSRSPLFDVIALCSEAGYLVCVHKTTAPGGRHPNRAAGGRQLRSGGGRGRRRHAQRGHHRSDESGAAAFAGLSASGQHQRLRRQSPHLRPPGHRRHVHAAKHAPAPWTSAGGTSAALYM